MKKLLLVLAAALSIAIVSLVFIRELMAPKDINFTFSYSTGRNIPERSDKEMHNLYLSKLEDIRIIFENQGIGVKEFKSEIYEGITIKRRGYIQEVPDYTVTFASYGKQLYYGGTTDCISLRFISKIDSNKIKKEGFKFEETELYKLRNIILHEIKNTDEINKIVNSDYKKIEAPETLSMNFTYDNITEHLSIDEFEIVYTIYINP